MTEPEVEDRLRAHVQFVLDDLFLPGELERWAFSWDRDRDTGERLLAVTMTAAGEQHYAFLWSALWTDPAGDQVPEEGLDMFASTVEDFIAESRFAWGQQRLLSARPWLSPAHPGSTPGS